MSLPLTRKQAYDAATWVKNNFGAEITSAVAGTPFDLDLVCGITCQESACFWLNFIDKLSVADILARCVLDASGDYPDTHRSAFPRKTKDFFERYGDEFGNMLIEEANENRKLRGFDPRQWIYKGYGIFQYDLQHVIEDESFFREKKWYRFDECLDRMLLILGQKYNISQKIWNSVRSYNGSGDAATNYANNVMQFKLYASEV